MSNVRLGDLLNWARKELSPLGEEEARASAEALLMELTGLERSFLYLEKDSLIAEKARTAFSQAVSERLRRVPLAYLTHKAYFWDLCLEVGPGCLIPRQETEILVDAFVRESGFSSGDRFSFLDLCCGSGAIGIAILRIFLEAKGTFSDISPDALAFTEKNIRRFALDSRASVKAGNLFEAFPAGKVFWDAVLCNPPYLCRADWDQIQPELLHEPKTALDGGADGYDFYRRIAGQAGSYLRKGGLILLELGRGQSAPVEKLLEQHGFIDVKIFCDYLNIDRVIMGRKAS